MSRWRLAAVVALGLSGLAPVGPSSWSASASASASADGAAAGPTCHGVRATIVGTRHADNLRGTPARDVIVGFGGDDRIHGLGGNDVICGGDGDDGLWGGPGADLLDGGRGSDGLHGGYDQLRPTRGGLVWYGDFLVGGPGDDLIDPGVDPGTPGHPGLGGAADQVSYRRARGPVRVDLSGRVGHARGGAGNDRIVHHRGLTVSGSVHHPDVLIGSAYDDSLTGGEADDLIVGGPGSDGIDTSSHAFGVHDDDVALELRGHRVTHRV